MQVATFYPKLGNAKKFNLRKFNKPSYQANGDLVIMWIRNIPVKDDYMIKNIWNSYIWTAK